LYVIHSLPNNRTFYADLAGKPVNVCPIECQAFADPESQAQTQQSHRAEWFSEFRNELLELIERKTTRSICPLGCTAHSDQSHRIALCRHIAAPHSELPKLMQNASNMNSAFGRQRERMQPQFNGARLYVSDRTLSPVRKDVVCQPLIIAVACAEPLRHSFFPIDLNQAADRDPGRLLRFLRHQRACYLPRCCFGRQFLLRAECL